MSTIGRHVSRYVTELKPTNVAEADIMFVSGWYCFFGHVTSELMPDFGIEFRSSLLYMSAIRDYPDNQGKEIVDRTVEAIEYADDFFEQVSDIAEDCRTLFSTTHPNVDTDEINHIEFNSFSRSIKFHVN